MRNRPDIPSQRLASPVFLGALALLLLNDHLLKSIFHNWATEKLSDVVGLYAFAFFWVAFLPRRRAWVGFLVAAAWVWWKSPLSGPALAAWNAVGPFTFGRTVDYTVLETGQTQEYEYPWALDALAAWRSSGLDLDYLAQQAKVSEGR